MSRICDVTGRKPMFGNNVSHAHNKTRRRFDLNLQKKRFWLADENRWVTLTVSTQGLRLIDKIGLRKVLNNMKAKGKKPGSMALIALRAISKKCGLISAIWSSTTTEK